ncbi:MAG: M20/M25/M40 family metallo-hydrolase [Longimicrobiales bacterium]
MNIRRFLLLWSATLLLLPHTLAAQEFPVEDPVLKAIWSEGMEHSQIYHLAQTLSDSIGPRLPGSPAFDAAAEWILSTYQSWGIPGRTEEYGTWRAWERGITHVDLLAPRVRSLDGMMQAWSPGTDGPVSGPVVILPQISNAQELEAFAATVRGKFVLMNEAEASCRTMENWEEWATPETLARIQEAQEAARMGMRQRMQSGGISRSEIVQRIEDSGALGTFSSSWTGYWGSSRVSASRNGAIPDIAFGCEDYGLMYRLAAENQGPAVRVDAEVTDHGTAPTYNVIGEIRGSERPDEYIILSAHLDSWDGGSGSTDNITGTVTMMEALRILQKVYPNPKRTLMVALWNGEEQGLNGSRAFVADHPEIVENIQAVFNQDNGTGRVVDISMQGLTGVAPYFGEWMTALPNEISRHIDLTIPGMPGTGGSDYASFVCAGVPAFSLRSLSWEYGQTYHNPTDTFDKIVIDEIVNNATLTAMLTYLASEEPDKLPRDTRIMSGINPRTGEPMAWPQCREPARNADGYFNR